MSKLQALGLPGRNLELAPHTESQQRPRQAAVTPDWSVVFFTSKKTYKGGLSWWPPNEISAPGRHCFRSLRVSPPEGLYNTVLKAASLKRLLVKEQCVPRTGAGEEAPLPGASSQVTQWSHLLHHLDAEPKKQPPCRAEMAT